MSKTQQNKKRKVKLHNRIGAIMCHTNRYFFNGPRSRLAIDAGVSKSAVSRLLNGDAVPSYTTITRIVSALERELGRCLDVNDLFSERGEYRTRFICDLVGCDGCLPSFAFDKDGNGKEKYRDLKPGYWTGDIYEADGPFWMPIEEID